MKSGGGKDGSNRHRDKAANRGGGGGAPPDRDTVDENAMEEMGYSRDEEYVYYMLAPPWARHKDPILYL